jgi:ribosomal protein S18 acetylase RimI-like enzyme
VADVRVAEAADASACAAVLAALPDFFTPDTHAQVAPAIEEHRGWVVVEDGAVVGFLIAETRYDESAEITFAAVVPDRRGSGLGTALVNEAMTALARDGIKVVEVKTLDASSNYEPYVATRGFWAARGFRQIDCIDPLPGWQPGNPSAIYVAALAPTT